MLEPRRLLAVHPLVVTEAFSAAGVQLRIWGTDRRQDLTITQDDQGIHVRNFDWRQTFTGDYSSIWIDVMGKDDRVTLDPSVTLDATIYGGKGNDILLGGSGNDTIHGGAGDDILHGGAGDDVLITLRGGKNDRVTGGPGRDTFWTDTGKHEVITDAGNGEKKSARHRVSKFYAYQFPGAGPGGSTLELPVPSTLKGQNLYDPHLDDNRLTYQSFNGRPLFSSKGPSPNDVKQGLAGDCYFMATLASVAHLDPGLIRDRIIELEDGTYVVHFKRDGENVFVRVDAELPVWSESNQPAYAGLGAENSMWVAIMEKAWAFFRYDASSYNSIEAGWMSETYEALGINQKTVFSAVSEAYLAKYFGKKVEIGRSVTLATRNVPPGSHLIDQHAYTVMSLERNGSGDVLGFRLHNPWGIDGAGDDGLDDGYLTVTVADVFAGFWAITIASV